jgi:hypothetical protein
VSWLSVCPVAGGGRGQSRAAAAAVGGGKRGVSLFMRSMLTEIYLCPACSYHEIEDGNARAGRAALRTGWQRYEADMLLVRVCVFRGGSCLSVAMELIVNLSHPHMQ